MTASTLTLPASATTMDEDRRKSDPGRRDADHELVRHVRAADAGLSLVWRWASIITTIVCFGFTLGVTWTKFDATEKAITEMRGDIRDSNKAWAELDKRTDQNTLVLTREVAEKDRAIEDLRQQVRELRTVVDTMRNMREAYVYSSAKGKSNSQPAPPP